MRIYAPYWHETCKTHEKGEALFNPEIKEDVTGHGV